MTYYPKEYTLHNGKKIYAEYDDHNICQITKECLEMLLDLYQQGRADAIDDFVKFANTMPTVEEEDGTIRPMWLEEIAEQLKEQNK